MAPLPPCLAAPGESLYVRVIAQKFSDCFAQRAGAVNYSHFAQTVQETFIEKVVGKVNGFVGLLADQLQFRFDACLGVLVVGVKVQLCGLCPTARFLKGWFDSVATASGINLITARTRSTSP